MITHNGTYLLHATHHGMPIYAATMGGKMVIGYGLLSATLQAIVAAFGAEGTEVIRKTNDYLNRIATTDPQRALLLAGFINEDPLLVTSLVETSKTRWLDNGGTALINLGESVLQYPFGVKAMLKYNALGGERDYCGNEGTTRRYPLEMGVQSGQDFGMWSNPSGWWTPTKVAVDMVLEFDARFDETSRYLGISKDGARKEEYTKSYNNNIIQANQNVALFAGGVNGYCVSDLCAAYYEVMLNGRTLRLVPFRRNGQMEMLDILTGNLATRVGTFTEQLTPTTPA